ncbi:MAG: hypothetical protein EXQ63_06190 [Ilumatobacteraceae bacterium]|nr:hypothetical protein [Ilumatobacteraceae bacterium]
MVHIPKIRIGRVLDAAISATESNRRWQLVATALLSTLCALVIFGATSNSRAEHARWGALSRALVATADIAPGSMLTQANTASLQAPQHLVPQTALNALRVGMTTSRQILASSIITALDIVGNGDTTLPNGWRIVAFPADVIIPDLAIGNIVDVVTAGAVIAADAVVMTPATQERGVEIAVPADLAATVAAAINNGDTSLVASG